MQKYFSSRLFRTNVLLGIVVATGLTVVAFGLPRVMSHVKADDGGCTAYPNAQFNPFKDQNGQYSWTAENGTNCLDFAPIAADVVGTHQWSDNVQANVGDEIVLRVYAHNGAASNSGSDLHNASYAVGELDQNPGTQHRVSAWLSSSESNISSHVIINTPDGAHLEIESGDPMSGSLGDNGTMHPCWNYSEAKFIYVKVVGAQIFTPSTTGTITASLNNVCPATVTVSWNTQHAQAVAEYDQDNRLLAGDFANTITDAAVQPGKTYTYSIWNVDWSGGTPRQLDKVAESNSVTIPTNCGSSNASIQLTTDSASYCVGTQPVYTVTNPDKTLASDEILFSSTKNGAQTNEIETPYGFYLNVNGVWSYSGRAWTTGDIGQWTKTAHIRGTNVTSTASFEVKDCSTPAGPTPTVISFNASFVCANVSNPNNTGTISWQTSNVNNVRVYVKTNNDPEQDFSNEASATKTVNWMQPSNTYVFTLRGDGIQDHVQRVDTQSCGSTPPPVNPPTPIVFTATASANATATCSNGTSATASGTGTGTSTVSFDDAMKTAKINATANATANASVNCGSTPPPAPLGNLSCYATPNPANVNDFITFSATGGTGTFTWNINGHTFTGNPINNVTFSHPGTFNATVSNSAGQNGSCNVVVNQPASNQCTLNTAPVVTADMPVKNGDLYSTTIHWQSAGSNGIKITLNSTTNVITSGGNTGSVQVNNLQPGTAYTFYMINNSSDSNCVVTLASVIVNVPNPTTPTTVTNNNSNNTNTNNNNQTSYGNNSANQNNQSIINGNNNIVTQTNNNCVNNSCNNSSSFYYVTTAGATVSYTNYSQLSISKLVRDVTTGTSLSSSVTANSNDVVEFQITVSNSGGQQANNVRVSDPIPSGLSFLSGATRQDGSYVSDSFVNGGSMYLGSLSSGSSHTITFQARVFASASASIQNTATASADNASSVQSSAWVFVNPGNVLGGNVNLTFSKRAFNDTKSQDATSVTASRQDSITYTLTVNNNGNAPATNFIITDDLSQVLPYADIIDNGGGSVSGNVITFPGVTVPAGGSVSKSFRVQVKSVLASSLTYVMSNTYGNTVTISINQPQVLGAFTAPKTGADTLGFVFAGTLTAAFALFQKRKMLTQLILNN